MNEFLRVTVAVTAAAATCLPAAPARASGGSCLPRALTAEEQRAGERVAARLRPLLPPPPAGWKAEGTDTTDIASGSCLDATTHKSVPQPVSVQVHRRFVREGPPPTAPAPTTTPTPAQAPDPQSQLRIRTLEQQVADLKRQDQEATAAYMAARRAGDSAAQQAASARSRAARLDMNAPLKELAELRRSERLQRQAGNGVRHDAAVAHQKAVLAARRLADVTITTNSGRALARASKVVPVPGAALAIRQPGFSTSLLLGSGWTHALHEAYRPWDRGASTTRVQDVNIRVEGNDEVMRALIGELDLKALNGVIER